MTQKAIRKTVYDCKVLLRVVLQLFNELLGESLYISAFLRNLLLLVSNAISHYGTFSMRTPFAGSRLLSFTRLTLWRVRNAGEKCLWSRRYPQSWMGAAKWVPRSWYLANASADIVGCRTRHLWVVCTLILFRFWVRLFLRKFWNFWLSAEAGFYYSMPPLSRNSVLKSARYLLPEAQVACSLCHYIF